jgi:cell division protein FtsA
MAKINYTCGIDIGTHTTRVVVLGFSKESDTPEIIATGSAETEGMRLGYVQSVEYVAASIKRAVNQAEKTLGQRIKRAHVSIGGISLASVVTTGEAVTSRADQEVTHLDVTKALTQSEENLDITNKRILHILPLGYKLDGKEILGRPEGMKGIKLEIRTLFIVANKQHIEDLEEAFSLAGIEIEELIAGPIATSTILLSQKQKAAGCALLDIGAETVSLALFENNKPLSLQVFSIGGMDITKDIALGFRISLDDAENLKKGAYAGNEFPRRKVDEIIDARLGDIFELVSNHLKRQRRNELLPAGVVVCGGGAHISKIEESIKSQLRLPCRSGSSESPIHIEDASWYMPYALASYNKNNDTSNESGGGTRATLKNAKDFFKTILTQLLP